MENEIEKLKEELSECKLELEEQKALIKIVASSAACGEAVKKGTYALKVSRLLNETADEELINYDLQNHNLEKWKEFLPDDEIQNSSGSGSGGFGSGFGLGLI